jgi:hypothetical protein
LCVGKVGGKLGETCSHGTTWGKIGPTPEVTSGPVTLRRTTPTGAGPRTDAFAGRCRRRRSSTTPGRTSVTGVLQSVELFGISTVRTSGRPHVTPYRPSGWPSGGSGVVGPRRRRRSADLVNEVVDEPVPEAQLLGGRRQGQQVVTPAAVVVRLGPAWRRGPAPRRRPPVASGT